MKIIFCLPGSHFSGTFLDSWTDLLVYCIRKNITFAVSRKESPVIYYVRTMCLGGDVLRGPDQKPFNGEVDYTHIMWIDSDIVFRPEQFQMLIDADKDIVCSPYMMKGSKYLAVVEHWNEEHFKTTGSFQFMTDQDLAKKHSPFKAAYCGMGFMLVKKGVFESLQYPWFQPIFHEIGNARDFSSEDVSFCLTASKNGYQIHVHPQARVGHEKTTIL